MELFFLVCFVVGFSFSVLAFLGGFSSLHLHFHLPKHIQFSGGHAGLPTAGHGIGHGAAAASHGAGAQPTAHGAAKGSDFPFFNPMTIAAFLTWFGGTGYLLVHVRHMWIIAGFLLASLAGLIAAGIVFWFVAKVLMGHEKELDPLDYEMIGVLGHVSSSIRSGGTGEIIFAQEGVRKPCAARSENGESLAKGEEVVVTRYERGIAYVRRWDELANSSSEAPEQKTAN